MYTIMLVDMPFSNFVRPSIALTQLRSVLASRFSDRVATHIIYLTHDFAKFLGPESYFFLSHSMEAHNSGLGDWFFRQEAFPDSQDNTDAYRQRYFPHANQARQLKDLIDSKRPKLGPFMESLISLYKLDRAQIVGFTSMFMQNTACFAMARRLKERNPEIITIMGGANCEYPMGEVIAQQVKAIDFTFSGPALKGFPAFVQHCLDGDHSSCQSIPGVFSKRSPSRTSAETIGEELDIDTRIELDYDSFIRRLERYFPASGMKAILPFETSRGCWWGQRAHCTFCGLNGASMGYRSMKAEVAIKQFESLFRYSGKVSHLASVDNILPKSYLQEVLPLLQTPANMEIFYEVKADLSEKDIAVLARARVKNIQPGVEALATSTLKLMKKGTTVFQNLSLLQLCARYEIDPAWNLLVGFPGEGKETYQKYVETLPLLFHLPPPTGVYPVRFDRFSPYHSQPQTYGLDLKPTDFYSLIYPFRETDLKRFAYYFEDRNVGSEYRTIMLEWLGKIQAQVDAWRSRWTDPHNVRPRLHFAENSRVVVDSRSGSVVEHSLGEITSLVLIHLSRPLDIRNMTKQLSAEIGHDISQEIELLEKMGLVFREGDRMLSLVFPETSVRTRDEPVEDGVLV